MQNLSFGRLGKAALDLLYPPRCVLCGAGGVFLCERCIEALPAADGPRCDRCWLPLRGDACLACLMEPGQLAHLRAVFRYERGVRQVVHAFKFSGQSSLAPDIGRLMAGAYTQHGLEADVIVPVPLTGARQRARGYNQALLMANEVSKLNGVPVLEALRRTGNSVAQASSASAEERHRNVEGVFRLAKGRDVSGARVLLIDDVATTGATLNACAAVLLAARRFERLGADAGPGGLSGLGAGAGAVLRRHGR